MTSNTQYIPIKITAKAHFDTWRVNKYGVGLNEWNIGVSDITAIGMTAKTKFIPIEITAKAHFDTFSKQVQNRLKWMKYKNQ